MFSTLQRAVRVGGAQLRNNVMPTSRATTTSTRSFTSVTLPTAAPSHKTGPGHVHSPTCGCTPSSIVNSNVGDATHQFSSQVSARPHGFIGNELQVPTDGPLVGLFNSNRRWVQEMVEGDEKFFSRHVQPKQPDFLYIGCADFRVTPNHMLGLGMGELFVHRNIANMVIGSDLSVQSVLEFAVDYLQVKHIIVCGHYGCAGVEAACANSDLGMLNFWLGHIREVHRVHRDELEAYTNKDERLRRLVELNVGEQCLNVYKSAVVQRHQSSRNFPTIHGLVYDVRDGLVHQLPVDFEGYAEAFGDVFGLGY